MRIRHIVLNCLGVTLAALACRADVVDPGGKDEWKSFEVEIKQLDKRTFPAVNLKFTALLNFAQNEREVDLNTVTQAQARTETIRVPVRSQSEARVDYKVEYYTRAYLFADTVASGTKKATIEFKTIDVSPMKVVRQDGSTYSVEDRNAWVAVSLIDGKDKEYLLAKEFHTSQGLVVPVGFRYRVTVVATTEDGEDEYKTLLDFRKQSGVGDSQGDSLVGASSLVRPVVRHGTSKLLAPSSWTYYSCTQKCGLTENTTTTVHFQSIDKYASLRALSDFCTNHRMSLQGQPNCSEQAIDNSRNEKFQRCSRGINAQSCYVTVHGYGLQDVGYQSFQAASNESFAKAEAQAMDTCRSKFSYSAKCVVSQYYAY